jgi:hypothetical protein
VQTHGERRSADNQPVSKGGAKGLLRVKAASVSKDGEFQIEPHAIVLQFTRLTVHPVMRGRAFIWLSQAAGNYCRKAEKIAGQSGNYFLRQRPNFT